MSRFVFAAVLLLAVPAAGAEPVGRPAAPKNETQKLRDEVAALKAEVERLKVEVADLQEKFGRLRIDPGKPPAVPDKADEAAEAAKAGRVVAGQTKAQARGVLDGHSWTTSIKRSETLINGKRVRKEVWVVNENNAAAFQYPNRITLENDVVVRVE